ncbi:hypothetical protein HHL11_20730 [Ramlibacter sp. G-1-2-2]|uniref:UGSC-like domain-containing protein n=1 Tax=Ramlibacter agri TaxID=2728837 RepID=A0A848H5B9_9BURK|nr:hypothetical protein [Ramlibacter agri]NML46186.1 hypothetical protein [Ramlibacter agri]
MPEFQVLNPRGEPHPVTLRPLAPRPASLDGLQLGLVNSWPGADSGFAPLFEAIRARVAQRFPRARIVALDKPSAYSIDDAAFWDRIVASCDAFVYAAAPSASTTHYAVHYTARLETRGRPGAVAVYDTLREDARNSVHGCGSEVRWTGAPYPLAQAAPAVLAALADRLLDQLATPLREHEQRSGTRPPPQQARIAFEGDYDAVQEFFHAQRWSDGLPVTPPTPAAVARMLQGTSASPQAVVTEAMGPENWRVTVEKVATVAVMAGCTPACLPVVLGAVQAFSAGANGLPSAYSTPMRATNSFALMQVVNGPIRHAAGMNAGLNALGPGNRANASIGRALRLALVNLGGLDIGSNALPVQGNPAAYTLAFAENEEASPWPSLAQRRGFGAQESVLTLMVGGWSHVGNYIAEGLERLARDVTTLEYPSGLALLLSPERARLLAAQGLDAAGVEDFVWQRAALPAREVRSGIYWTTLIAPNLRGDAARRLWDASLLTAPDEQPVPVYPRAQVTSLVVGGDVSPMMQAWKMQYPVSVSLERWLPR